MLIECVRGRIIAKPLHRLLIWQARPCMKTVQVFVARVRRGEQYLTARAAAVGADCGRQCRDLTGAGEERQLQRLDGHAQ